jgi:hypothetical protein
MAKNVREFMFHDPKTSFYALGDIYARNLTEAKKKVRTTLGYKTLRNVSVWAK